MPLTAAAGGCPGGCRSPGPRPFQVAVEVFRQGHRAVLPAGAADSDGQLGLPLFPVQGQQVIRSDRGSRVTKPPVEAAGTHSPHGLLQAGAVPQLGDVKGLGGQRTSNTKSASRGEAVLEPKDMTLTKSFWLVSLKTGLRSFPSTGQWRRGRCPECNQRSPWQSGAAPAHS